MLVDEAMALLCLGILAQIEEPGVVHAGLVLVLVHVFVVPKAREGNWVNDLVDDGERGVVTACVSMIRSVSTRMRE